MKKQTLILLRHGEASDWAPNDASRALTENGKHQAQLAGLVLKSHLRSCDVAIVSHATRARETADLVLSEFKTDNMVIDSKLYSAGSFHEFISVVNSHAKENDRSVLIVGHNPIISLVASELSGENFRFAPSEYAILSIESDNWTIALASTDCWTAETP